MEVGGGSETYAFFAQLNMIWEVVIISNMKGCY